MTDKSQSFQDLLDKDTSVTIHQRNIRNLATEIWKFLQGYFPPILSEVFTERDCNYNVINFWTDEEYSVRYGDSISFTFSSESWNIFWKEIKNSKTLDTFKAKNQKMVSFVDFVKYIYCV